MQINENQWWESAAWAEPLKLRILLFVVCYLLVCYFLLSSILYPLAALTPGRAKDGKQIQRMHNQKMEQAAP